jgi:hypothetical protein
MINVRMVIVTKKIPLFLSIKKACTIPIIKRRRKRIIEMSEKPEICLNVSLIIPKPWIPKAGAEDVRFAKSWIARNMRGKQRMANKTIDNAIILRF